VLWLLGCVIYLLMMATGFMGYVLPWGQMSYYGAVVITNLFSAIDGVIPGAGTAVTTWLWGGFAVDNATLNRFFSLHYLLPFMIAGVVGLHIWALHVPGNNNPTGVSVKSKADTVPFHPYYTVKDGFAVLAFLILFAWFVFFAPEALGHADNYIPANPLQTPAHIVPEWYFLPFYAILRSVPNKLFGVGAMFGAIGMLFLLPWLDTSKVRSMRYRPVAKVCFGLFILSVLVLGWCGGKEPDDVVLALGHDAAGDPTGLSVTTFSQFFVAYYYGYFLLIMPILGLREKTLPVPDTISTPVLSHGGHALPSGATAEASKKG
jgi:quinol-cytochrome oxidoreductase complex cytochrome b subunit